MGHAETNATHDVMKDLSKSGTVLFKNVRGLFWTLDRKRKILAGLLMRGASDLIGFTPVVVTQEMVGKTVAVFTAIEMKRPNGGKEEDEQENFIQVVLENGGYAGFARDIHDARKIIGK